MKFCNLSSVSCPHIRPSMSSPAISAFPLYSTQSSAAHPAVWAARAVCFRLVRVSVCAYVRSRSIHSPTTDLSSTSFFSSIFVIYFYFVYLRLLLCEYCAETGRFVEPIRDRVVQVGETATFECRLRHSSAAYAVTWSVDNNYK